MVPMMFGIGVYYVDLVLSRRFLSELGTGAQSYFAWAMRLCDFPQGIFVMAISTAALPSLSSLAAKKDMHELAQTYAHGMRLALFVAIPSSVALAVLGEPLVATLFQRGQFDAVAAHETARSLVFQGGAIWTVAAVRQLVPVFYALGDTRTPVVVSAIDLLAFIALALLLRDRLGHAGISAAVAGSSFVQMALLFFFLRKRLGTIMGPTLLASSSKILASSLVAAAAGWSVAGVFAGSSWLPGLASGLAFSIVFFAAAAILRSEELLDVTRGLRRRLSAR
jgi:putative peptidoglycan lipid II flippase